MANKTEPEIIDKKTRTPFGGDRLLGVFLDANQKPCDRSVARYFFVKELIGGSGICKALYSYKDGKLAFMNRTFIKPKTGVNKGSRNN